MRRHPRAGALAVVIFIGALVAACGSGSQQSAPSGGGTPSSSEPSQGATTTPDQASSAPDGATTTTVFDSPEVVVIGDSLVFQSSEELERRFDEARLRLAAEPGETLREQQDAVRAAVARGPDVVVVLLGTNDVLQGTDRPAQRIRSAMDRLDPVPCVRWLTIAPFWGQEAPVRILNEVIRRTAADHDNTEVVEWGRRVERHPEWFADLVHYGPEGERALADTIIQAAHSCGSNHHVQ